MFNRYLLSLKSERLAFILLLSFILIFLFSPKTSLAASWYNSNWPYRVKVTIDHTKASSTLTDFPVYLNLNNFNSNFFSHIRSDGGDVRITESDGVTEIPREVVSVNTTSSTGEVYFKASSISSATDTIFYIYYGNASATEPVASSTYGAQNVWTNGYVGVWHLQSTSWLDSTSNSYNGIGYNNVSTTSGPLGNAVVSDGGTKYIDFGDKSNFDFGTNNFTLSS